MLDVSLQWIEVILMGIPTFFTNPFTYLLLLVIGLQWKRQIDMERKLFSARLHTVAEGILQSVFYGMLGGGIVSLAFIGLGVVFSLEPFLYLWIIAIVLMLFHVRYLCFAYAGAILGLAVLIVTWFPQGATIPLFTVIWDKLEGIYLPSLFAMVALLHLAEALLVYLVGGKRGTPIFIQSKRGRLVGGYHLQHFWLVPLFLVVDGGSSSLPVLYDGWPLLAGYSVGPLSLLLLPAVLAFSEQAVSTTPAQKARSSAKGLALYSLVLLALTIGSLYLEVLIVAAVFFSFLGHEALIFYSRWKEEKRSPIYVHPKEGLKILAVIPHTPAEKMGLQVGEVIVKVNGAEVKKRRELYRALKSNLAFCKLEVLNLQGHLKFAKSSLYEQDHHQLGVILAPDEDIPYYLESKEMNLWKLIRQRLGTKSHRSANASETRERPLKG